MRASFPYSILAAVALWTATARDAAAGQVIVVKIIDMAFSPATVKAKVGDVIEWSNADFLDHTATANDNSFDIPLATGESARLELKRRGTVSYYCRVHPNMIGSIDVE